MAKTKIKLTKEESAAYMCKAVYSYKGHIIHGDDTCFSGDHCYWYCEDIWGDKGFWNLRGLRKALADIEDGVDPDTAHRKWEYDL